MLENTLTIWENWIISENTGIWQCVSIILFITKHPKHYQPSLWQIKVGFKNECSKERLVVTVGESQRWTERKEGCRDTQ